MFESLSVRLQAVTSRLRGQAKLTEADLDAALREVRLALLEADVNFRVVKSFVAHAPGSEWPAGSPATLVRGIELRLPIGGLVDRNELIAKLRKDEGKLDVEVKKITGRLGNPGFVAKAPPEVIEKDRALAEELGAKLANVRANLARIAD